MNIEFSIVFSYLIFLSLVKNDVIECGLCDFKSFIG